MPKINPNIKTHDRYRCDISVVKSFRIDLEKTFMCRVDVESKSVNSTDFSFAFNEGLITLKELRNHKNRQIHNQHFILLIFKLNSHFDASN